MDILNELMDCFALTLDDEMLHNARYQQLSAEINAFCENNLSHEHSEQINELFFEMMSLHSRTQIRAGMKLGARIIAGLLAEPKEGG